MKSLDCFIVVSERIIVRMQIYMMFLNTGDEIVSI